MKITHLLSGSLALSLLVVSSSAFAQTGTPKKAEAPVPNQEMPFTDADDLTATSPGASQMAVRQRAQPARSMLVKPRLSFIAKILKNVENL